MRLRHFATALSAVSLLSFAAAACSEHADETEVAHGVATTEPAPPIEANALPDDAMATDSATAIDPAHRAPQLVPEAEKGEKGARNVLLTWARALENKQFARARAQWGERGRRSGMSQAAYAAQFDGYRRIAIGFGEGEVEGAAGSLYYEVPVTFTGVRTDGTTVERSGTVVLRRVNDVPGATAEQLRWHIDGTTLRV